MFIRGFVRNGNESLQAFGTVVKLCCSILDWHTSSNVEGMTVKRTASETIRKNSHDVDQEEDDA
jgi:hypothetical protein